MQEAQSDNNPSNFDDQIDLRNLFSVILDGKWLIISVTAFVATIGVLYSLLLPNIYESKAILVPVNPSSGIYSSIGGYGGLAGLAGIRIPGTSDEGNSAKATKKINTLSFFENNILANIHLPDLMAVKSWKPKTNTLVYDENIYDISSNTWITDDTDSEKIPSAQKSFRAFKNKHLSFSEDRKTGFITLSIKHQSPIIAKQWAELIVNEVNGFYRQKDKSESEKAVSYLNKQISMTSFSEIKQVLAQLLQEETKKLTLIEANEYYVFDYIDPPAIMEKKSEPNRAFICIFFTILGGILSILLVLIRHYFFNERTL